MKQLILLVILIAGVNFSAKSSHAVGGDIQFTQTGANSYNISMRLFRYCSGINYSGNYTLTIMDQVACNTVQTVSVSRVSQTNILFGDECYTPPGLCVQQHEYTGTISSLPNNPNGYMVKWSENARNTIVNMATASLGLYTKIPDPALAGGNSTPRFVDYPSDGYFCIGNAKCIDFSCTDADGDSLVYSLHNPISTFTGCAPNYLAFRPTFNMTNVLGPGSICTIDASTGCVWARPAQLGLYVISVKVEEYRNGVKIGETIRDVQYAALNCNYNKLPQFENFPTINALNFDEEGCFDIVASDIDVADSFYMSIFSNAFDYGATVSLPSPNSSGLHDFSWQDATTGTIETANNVNVMKLSETNFMGVGKVGARFCWDIEECDVLSVDSFYIEAVGYSIGCDASKDSVRKRVSIPIVKPEVDYQVPNVFSPNGDGINDFFYLKKQAYDRCYDAANVKVYNRWGQLVFSSDNANFEWDGKDENGKELSGGSYFVILQGFYGGKEVTQNFPLTLFR
ncbi:MAG: gliding motility-associated C-terminal domain-containing protein [Flavobacteriales bacterium]